MSNSRAGAIIYRHKLAQEKIDAALDRKYEPYNIPKPVILANCVKQWTFQGGNNETQQ